MWLPLSSADAGNFDNGEGLVNLGGRVGVTAGDPKFECRTSDVSCATEGDVLVTGSTNYTIRDQTSPPRPRSRLHENIFQR